MVGKDVGYTGSGLQELNVISPDNDLDCCYPNGCSRVMDTVVEFYYHNGVVSEILGTVRLVRCWLMSPPDRKIGSVSTLSVVVGEMFKRSRPRMVKD